MPDLDDVGPRLSPKEAERHARALVTLAEPLARVRAIVARHRALHRRDAPGPDDFRAVALVSKH